MPISSVFGVPAWLLRHMGAALIVGGVLAVSTPAIAQVSPKALTFDGNDEVNFPIDPALDLVPSSDYTIELCVYLVGTSYPYHIFGMRPGCDTDFYQLACSSPTVFGFSNGQFGNTLTSHCSVGTDEPSHNSWQHVAVTHIHAAGDTLHMYINGALVSTELCTPQQPVGGTLELGGAGRCPHFQGRMTELRLWAYARSAGDIAQFFNQTVDPTSPGLVAYWNFNEPDDADQHVRDITCHGHDGCLGGSYAVEDADPTRGPSGLMLTGVPMPIRTRSTPLRVVPNPLNRTISLQFSSAAPGFADIEILDVAGRAVRHERRWVTIESAMMSLEARDDAGGRLARHLHDQADNRASREDGGGSRSYSKG